MKLKQLIIGTRGSKLALVQTRMVEAALRHADPDLTIDTQIITTKGDTNQSPIPLDTVGKTWFTEEIEQALLDDRIDLAVHSLKDLPPDLPENLQIMAVLERADAADVLVSKDGSTLKNLKPRAIVGTDSLRRKALLLAARPDLIVQSIRGNIDTRLKKLDTENYDAIMIAAAGLIRLDLADRITERFDPDVFVPPPGQGILAVEFKQNRTELMELLQKIVRAPTATSASIELAFSKAIGAGCKLPIGCYAEIKANQVKIFAAVGNEAGGQIIWKSKTGSVNQGEKLAIELAKEF